MMGARLCTPFHPLSDQKSKSLGARDETTSLSTEFIKHNCLKVGSQRRLRGSTTENIKREREMEAPEKKTLEDWIKASPGLKPDSLNLKRGEPSDSYKQSKKKVHPCLSQIQCPRFLLSEAKDSLYLDRPLNHIHHEESTEMSDCSSIMRSLSGKSQKRVSFKLPHHVMFFSPDEPYCKEVSSEETYGSEDSFGSAMRPNGRGRNSSFDSTEEPVVRLAVDTLPHLF